MLAAGALLLLFTSVSVREVAANDEVRDVELPSTSSAISAHQDLPSTGLSLGRQQTSDDNIGTTTLPLSSERHQRVATTGDRFRRSAHVSTKFGRLIGRRSLSDFSDRTNLDSVARTTPGEHRLSRNCHGRSGSSGNKHRRRECRETASRIRTARAAAAGSRQLGQWSSFVRIGRRSAERSIADLDDYVIGGNSGRQQRVFPKSENPVVARRGPSSFIRLGKSVSEHGHVGGGYVDYVTREIDDSTDMEAPVSYVREPIVDDGTATDPSKRGHSSFIRIGR